jgi:hypothetical protein
MNKHIELVKKWLADPASVTLQELRDNRDAAYAGTPDAATIAAAYASSAASDAAKATAYYYATAFSVVAAYTDNARRWIKRYEELSK